MSWYSRALNLLQSKRLSSELDREMDFHLAERADALIGDGLGVEEAEREARRRFGHRTLTRETTRRIDVFTSIESFVSDVRLTARALRASPGFTLVIVLSLGLGIGANTAIFSLINAVMVRSLPVRHAAQLVTLVSTDHGDEITNPLWEQLRDRQHALADVAAFSNSSFNLTNGGETQRAAGLWVSGAFFSTLGVDAAAGRLLARGDDVRGCAPAAVLGYSFWQRQYGGSKSAIGTAITLDGHPYTIIGVTAPDFFGVEIGRSTQVYTPLCAMEVVIRPGVLDDPQQWFLKVIGRLPEGVSIARASALLDGVTPAVLSGGLAQKDSVPPGTAKAGFTITPGVRALSSLQKIYRGSLLTLMAVVVLVLLIACANVANLLLVRAASRQHEIAVRYALGASRLRVVRQLATETMLLTVIGVIVAVLFASWSSNLLVRLLSTGPSTLALDVPMDARVLLFTTAIAIVVGLLFGLPAAWRSARAAPQAAMHANSRSIASGHSRFSIAKVLVVGQVALSLVLVVAAGLFLGTFRTLTTLDPGFDANNVLLARVNFSKVPVAADDTSEATLTVVHNQLIERVRAIPGVTAVSTSAITPLSGQGWNGPFSVEGYVPASRKDASVFFNEVSDDFFATMHTRVLVGRAFDNRDQRGSPRVALINQTAARKFFAGKNPVGKVFHTPRRDDPGPAVEVIGVVEDAKYSSLREAARPVAYLPQSQSADPIRSINYEIRTSTSMPTLASEVTAAAKQVSPRIALEYTTLDRQIAASLTRERLIALLSAFFGALALLLAMVGLYGTMAYGVTRRRTEIGVRLALGATRTNVLSMVLGETSRLLVAGLVIGIIAALASARFVASLLYGVAPTDVETLAWSAITLAAVSLIAGALPAWRAAQLDPMIALRQE